MSYWVSVIVLGAILLVIYVNKWPRIQLGAVILLVLFLILREGTLVFSETRALFISSHYRDLVFQAYSDGVWAVMDFCQITGIFVIVSEIAIIVFLARGTKGRMDVFTKFFSTEDNSSGGNR